MAVMDDTHWMWGAAWRRLFIGNSYIACSQFVGERMEEYTIARRNSLRASVKKAIEEYHEAMNRGDWHQCLLMTCPSKLHKVNEYDFQSGLSLYMDFYGFIEPDNFLISLVLGKEHLLYNRKDYAQILYSRITEKQIIKVNEAWVLWDGEWKSTITRFPKPK